MPPNVWGADPGLMGEGRQFGASKSPSDRHRAIVLHHGGEAKSTAQSPDAKVC